MPTANHVVVHLLLCFNQHTATLYCRCILVCPHTKCCSSNLPSPQRGLTPAGNMDSIGPGRKPSSNGACESAGRASERLVADKNTTRGDHPMLTGNQEVKKTHYPYKEPRIDQRMYQAEIPPLQGGNSNRAVTRGSSSPRTGESVRGWAVIWEGRQSPKTNDFELLELVRQGACRRRATHS